MSDLFVFAAAKQAVVPVVGTDRLFPVHRIYCVGRNYSEHAKEMGFDERELPFFFTKPADAVLPVGTIGRITYPSLTLNLQCETELVVAIGMRGSNIASVDAWLYIYGYAVGLDMTRQDLQFALRNKGQPWDVSNGFDYSAPIGPIYPRSVIGNVNSGHIFTNVNGENRQDGNISKLIWSVAEIIEQLSRYYTLQPGDLIFTGTPEGVVTVKPGDLIESGVDSLEKITVLLDS